MALGVCLSVVFLSSLQRLLIGTFGAEETGLTRNKLPVVSATSVALHLRGLPRFLRGLLRFLRGLLRFGLLRFGLLRLFARLALDRQMFLASFA